MSSLLRLAPRLMAPGCMMGGRAFRERSVERSRWQSGRSNGVSVSIEKDGRVAQVRDASPLGKGRNDRREVLACQTCRRIATFEPIAEEAGCRPKLEHLRALVACDGKRSREFGF